VTYLHGQVAAFVPPPDRLAVREISGKFLSQHERIEIADPRRAGVPADRDPRDRAASDQVFGRRVASWPPNYRNVAM
jgi:hypothetical protein